MGHFLVHFLGNVIKFARFYFSAGGHIKTIFLKKTVDKSIKIEGFALKMMTFFKEAFQVNRKSYPERVRSALFHAIKKTAANLDACVKVPGKDFSRKRKLPLQTMLLMLIGMGGGSLSKELYDWFGYTPSTATASAFVQQRNKIRSRRISRKNGAAQREKVRCPGALGVGRIHPRDLKYTIGLSCLHGKKTDFLLQEVFARLILYKLCFAYCTENTCPTGKANQLFGCYTCMQTVPERENQACSNIWNIV